MKKQVVALFLFALIFLGNNEIFAVQSENVKTPNDLKWEKNPALPEAIQVALIYGDPSQNGPFVMRIKMPAGSKIPPHWHSIDENVTVLSGSFHIGEGDKFDSSTGLNLPKGSFISIPAKHHHYAWSTEETILQLNNFGQWDITYINPQDDPRKASH